MKWDFIIQFVELFFPHCNLFYIVHINLYFLFSCRKSYKSFVNFLLFLLSWKRVRFNFKKIKVVIAVFFLFFRTFEIKANTRWMALSITWIDDYKESMRETRMKCIGSLRKLLQELPRKDIWLRKRRYRISTNILFALTCAWYCIKRRKLKHCI